MKKERLIHFLRYIPILLCVLALLCVLIFSDEITVSDILNYVPESTFAAVIVIFFLYAMKSVSVMFPIIVLQVAVGHLFSPLAALIINNVGFMIDHTLPYLIGRISGSSAIDKLSSKYPAVRELIDKQQEAPVLSSFILRSLYFLPGDVVGMCLGSMKTPYLPYLFGSTLGSFPHALLSTFFGLYITEPSSPMFWISLVLMLLVSGGSMIAYYVYQKKNHAKK